MNRPHIAADAALSLLLIRHGSTSLETLLTFLLDQQLRLTVADSAEQGMALFEQELPDLTLICGSEGFDPCDLALALRQRWGCRSHTIIIGLGNSPAAWKRAFEAGAAAYIAELHDHEELAATMQRLQQRFCTAHDPSAELLEATRTVRLLDALPLGVVLFNGSERLLHCNRAAVTLTSLPPQGSELRLEDLFLQLYGLQRDATLLQIRTAMHSAAPWQDTVYCGQSNHTLRLELVPLQSSSVAQGYCLLTVQDVGTNPTAPSYQTLLSAAALDLLHARYLAPKEQTNLAAAITNGAVPSDDRFDLADLLQEAARLSLSSAVTPELTLPDYLNGSYSGNQSLLKQIMASLFTWAESTGAQSGLQATVALQGREGDRRCLRFSMRIVDRRQSRSSYQRGDEAIARQIALAGIDSLKTMRGIGLASLLANLLGSSLVIKQVAREGRTVLFDLWLRYLDQDQLLHRQEAATETVPKAQFWYDQPDKAGHTGQLRVLAAEDNPLEQANIRNLMERLGHQLVMVSNGREAVEECEQAAFDLILMDILMPVMDGFEAVRLIREHERLKGSQTPIIALTSYSLQAVQERCAKAGMNGYLPKPVSQAKMEELLHSFFRPPQPRETAPEPMPMQQQQTVPAPQQGQLPVLDVQDALINLGTDLSFFREMLTLFSTHGKPLLEELQQKLGADQPSGSLERPAHKLKGMASNIGAARLVALCERIQDDPAAGTLPMREQYRQELAAAGNELFATLDTLDWQALREQFSGG